MLRARPAAFFVLFAALTALPALGQSPSTAQPQNPPKSPNPAQSPAATQSSSSNPVQSATPAPVPKPAQAPAQENKKPKKVWTNDNLNDLSGKVSVVGDSSDSRTKYPYRGSGGSPAANSYAARPLRERLEQLRGQLDKIDRRISELRNFKADDTSPSGGIQMGGKYNMVPIADQIRRLEAQRKQVQAQIDDVEDQARKLGIEPGQLR